MGIATATGGWALNDLHGDDDALADGTGWPGAGEGVGVGSDCFLVAAGAATDGPAAAPGVGGGATAGVAATPGQGEGGVGGNDGAGLAVDGEGEGGWGR